MGLLGFLLGAKLMDVPENIIQIGLCFLQSSGKRILVGTEVRWVIDIGEAIFWWWWGVDPKKVLGFASDSNTRSNHETLIKPQSLRLSFLTHTMGATKPTCLHTWS